MSSTAETQAPPTPSILSGAEIGTSPVPTFKEAVVDKPPPKKKAKRKAAKKTTKATKAKPAKAAKKATKAKPTKSTKSVAAKKGAALRRADPTLKASIASKRTALRDLQRLVKETERQLKTLEGML